MALQLAIPTQGKRDELGFDPATLIGRFARYTGRKRRSEDHIEGMVKSLLENGQESPFVFRKDDDGFPVPVSGHTRIIAAHRINMRQETGWILKDGTRTEVKFGPDNLFKVYGRYLSCDELEAIWHTFAENDESTRKQMTGMDIALFLQTASEMGVSDAEIGRRLHKQPSQISGFRRFLKLDPFTQDLIAEERITEAVGLVMLEVPEDRRRPIFEDLSAGGKRVTTAKIRAILRDDDTVGKPIQNTLADFRKAMRQEAEMCRDQHLQRLFEVLSEDYWKGLESGASLVTLFYNAADVQR